MAKEHISICYKKKLRISRKESETVGFKIKPGFGDTGSVFQHVSSSKRLFAGSELTSILKFCPKP